MTDVQIFNKAIEKIGFTPPNGSPEVVESMIANNEHYPIIFSHEFARAFFGAEWENSLMSMVTKEQPLKYIEKHL